ncbi:MAG: flagellar basal body rod protein FlgF [Gammaproteobacteria bacterium]|nr:flagellar basal body rod protein FlgF [Gammaproteobacteria bacterium]MDH3537008.1 flagellar basal body rod protein FlgF [Gammaproteobacteria bacterium]
MDKYLYLAMNGAAQAMLAQQNNANNLANISTVGFKAALDHFQSNPVSGPGYLDRVYASNELAGANLDPGAVATTGRDLDLAINGDGWFAVQAADGSTAYTRRGDFRIDPAGLLLNGANQIVLGEGGPITIPQFESLQIGRDGTISVRGAGQAANTLVGVDRIRLVNPARDQLYRGDDGLFRSRELADIPADASVAVTSGALESSNVNAVDAMVRMIDYARYYEQQVKLMKLASENDAASARLMRMSG